MSRPDVDPKITRRQAENHRASIDVGTIVNRLQAAARNEIEMTPTAIKASQILLDKALPTLSSIDQTNITETPELGPDEIEAMLKGYLAELKQRDPVALRALVEPELVLVTTDAVPNRLANS